MADNKLLQQMLEHLVNDDQQKAEELFHEYVVAKSREIYESLIEDDLEEASKEEDDDEEMDEAAKDQKEEDEEDLDEASESDEDEEEMDENFEEIAAEGDDEMPAMGGDATDDLESELDADEEGMDEKEPEELFQDLDAIVDELQAKFDAMKGDDMGDMGDMGDEPMKDDFELETVREYVEKVADGHGAEKKGKAETADNTKSTIDNMKNDMGGTTANILSGRNGADSGSVGAGGTIKGSALSDTKPKDMNTGNINVPGGKAGKTGFTHKEPGHGAEKKGSAESADNKQSLFRGRR